MIADPFTVDRLNPWRLALFEIASLPVAGPAGGHRYVIDRSRDVSLQFVTGILNEPVDVFVLIWKDRPILFQRYIKEVVDNDGAAHLFEKIDSFGASSFATRRTGIPPFHFDSEKEKEDALELAAEALLVFGAFYDGLSWLEGRYRVYYLSHGRDRVVTLASFGYKPVLA